MTQLGPFCLPETTQDKSSLHVLKPFSSSYNPNFQDRTALQGSPHPFPAWGTQTVAHLTCVTQRCSTTLLEKGRSVRVKESEHSLSVGIPSISTARVKSLNLGKDKVDWRKSGGKQGTRLIFILRGTRPILSIHQGDIIAWASANFGVVGFFPYT